MKTIILRADGTAGSGLGHLYRALALAEMLSERVECVFVTRADSLFEIIPAKYKVEKVPAEIALPMEPEWLVKNYSPGTYQIILDGYQFDASYQKALKERDFRLIYIDDLVSEHMYADIVINHSPSAQKADYSAEPYTRFALGTDYALLRPGFLRLAALDRELNGIKNVFLCFGGSDPHNLTRKVLTILKDFNQVRSIHVVTGAGYQAEVESMNSNLDIQVHRNVGESELIRIMLNCDMGIVPTSTVLFELCCVKMPVLTGYYVGNQEKAYKAFVEKGMAAGVGNFIEASEEEISGAIKTILTTDASRFVKQQQLYFDGRQKERIMNLI